MQPRDTGSFPFSSFQMTTELSALARLLVYPRHQTLNELNKIDHILQNSRHLDLHTKENLKTFTVALSSAPMSALQNVYLASFEEDYKMLDLTQQNQDSAKALKLLENLYHQHGQDFSQQDVPHFLPAILEFLSTLSYGEALSWIKQAEPALRAIDRKLLDVSSPWLAVTDSLLSLSKRVAA